MHGHRLAPGIEASKGRGDPSHSLLDAGVEGHDHAQADDEQDRHGLHDGDAVTTASGHDDGAGEQRVAHADRDLQRNQATGEVAPVVLRRGEPTGLTRGSLRFGPLRAVSFTAGLPGTRGDP